MQLKEQFYLDAKMSYYNGNPIISDAEFDKLETELKSLGSTVIFQVGYKISDYDYPHPTKMYSLDKIQIVEGDSSYSFKEFEEWVTKVDNYRYKLNESKLRSEPKYDGNSVNIIFKDGVLYKALTRGDGTYGKDITNHIAHRFDWSRYFIQELPKDGIVEVRCEAIMAKNTFSEKYSSIYANSRNLISGLLGRDELTRDDSEHIDLIPLQVLHNSEHVDIRPLTLKESFDLCACKYTNMFEYWESIRDTYKYQLDGIVVSFAPQYRDEIGNGEKAPKWAIALKFKPDTADTIVESIDWQIGKSNEFTPVANIKPIQLMGTTVSRVTCNNAGFIIKNKINTNTAINVCKRGDIIPHIQEVYESSTIPDIPNVCPYCTAQTILDGIHLYCSNSTCHGATVIKLNYSTKALKIKGIGPSTLSFFAKQPQITNGVDFIIFAKQNICDMNALGFKQNHKKTYDNFVKIIDNIKIITIDQLIILKNINNLGPKIATQLGKEFSKHNPDYTGIDNTFCNDIFKSELFESLENDINILLKLGVEVKLYSEEPISEDDIFVEMTGSPKELGYNSKKEWIEQFGGQVKHCTLTDAKCMYLVTDDINSNTSKMKQAIKKGIKIIDYSHNF